MASNDTVCNKVGKKRRTLRYRSTVPGNSGHQEAGLTFRPARQRRAHARGICAGLRADSGGINAVVQKHLEGFPELQGRSVEVTQGAYPLFFAGLLGRPDEIAE